jgi:rod shape determining protein RodA
MKIATVLLLAWWLSDNMGGLRQFWKVIGAIVICAVPSALIFLQPDLGTAMIFIPLLFGMLFVAGVKKRVIALLILGLVLSGVLAFPFLKSYQKARLTSFINPDKDPDGSGYNIIQARITLGSGRIIGKGWGKGTQTALRFLPEHHTDFIYSSLAEQFGLLGCGFVLLAFGLLMQRMFVLLKRCQDEFCYFAGVGCALIIISHVLYNLGMSLGMLPVSGLPLPLLSYGGTFLVVTYFAFGLILNVSMKRYIF